MEFEKDVLVKDNNMRANLVSVKSFRKFAQTERCSLRPSIQHHSSTSKRIVRIKNSKAENNKAEKKQEIEQLRGVGDISTIENLLRDEFSK